MKFICVSHNFPPQNDAEALCTARFASALVDQGHEVWVVTASHAQSLDPLIEKELTGERLRVVRVPPPSNPRARSILAQARHRIRAAHAEWLEPAVKATRSLLRQHPDALLLSRAMPVVSNVVGFHCRDLARLWVAHFSDPYPIAVWKHRKRMARFADPFHHAWAKRIVGSADLVTVTCPNCVRYMEAQLGVSFEAKSHVTTHLAIPKLITGTFKFERQGGDFWLAHIGNLMEQRNPRTLLEGMARAAGRIPELRFLQYGNIDAGISLSGLPGLQSRMVLRNISNLSPRDASDLQRQVDVNVISDTDFGIDYSPLILSKYPHAACAGQPLLMLSNSDSAMGNYSRTFGGGMLASFRDPASVEEAIARLHDAWRAGDARFRPSEALQRQFAPESVVPPFLNRVQNLLARGERCSS